MTKPIVVDKWRTAYWLEPVKAASQLTAEKLELLLKEELGQPTLEIEISGQVRKYLNGSRAASFADARGVPATAMALASDRLFPGAYGRFSYPLFQLLVELYFWNQPHMAEQRFKERSEEEVRVGVRKKPVRSSRTSTRIGRIRDALISIDGSVMFFFTPSFIQGYSRQVSPVTVEAVCIAHPPTLQDFTVSLALAMEAYAMEDQDRWLLAMRLVDSTFIALLREPILSRFAGQIQELVSRLEDFSDMCYLPTELPKLRVAPGLAPTEDWKGSQNGPTILARTFMLNSVLKLKAVEAHVPDFSVDVRRAYKRRSGNKLSPTTVA